MDSALKQRMIGAAVLVALAVIFLPLLFDGPGRPAPEAGSLPLDVPREPERPLETRELSLTLPPPAQPPAASDPDAVATVVIDPPPRRDALDNEAPSPTASAPAPPADAAPARPAAAAAAPPIPDEPAPPGSRFVVNLGTYANRSNAATLLERLKRAGVQAYGENIDLDGKPALRLRAGPYASRAQAENARSAARRVQADLPASVVELPKDEVAPARVAPAVAGGFVVQVGAFKAESDAIALRDRLRGGGYTTYVERIATDAGPLWRVRVGPELQRARAEEARTTLRQRYQLDGQVLSHP